jgi:hypothetical protein
LECVTVCHSEQAHMIACKTDGGFHQS